MHNIPSLPNLNNGSEDGLDWAYRRSLRACRLCRKKKVRCDGAQPACAQCAAHRSQCVYLPRAVRNPQSRLRRSKQSSGGGCSRNNEGDQSMAPSSVVATAGDGLLPTPSKATAPTSANQELPVSSEPSILSTMHHSIGPGTQQTRYHEGETATLDIAPYLVGNGDADILGLSLQRFAEFPMDTPFLDNAFNSCNFPPDFIVQEGSHDTATKTPDYNALIGDIMFRACTTLDNDSTSLELSPENTSSVSEQPIVGGSNDVFLAHTTQSSPERSESQNTSGWQGDIEEDDLSHLLLQSASGFINYLGPNFMSIPGTELGRKFISEMTGSTYFSDHMTAFLKNWSPSTPNISEHGTYDKFHLPSYEVAQTWIDAYFDSVQCTYPILDRSSFMAEFHRTYEYLSPETDPVWCAMINTILATGCRVNPSSNEDQYCNLFTNALGLFGRVALSMCSLRKVQTLMLMYLFVSSNYLPHWGYTVLALAVKEAQAIGLQVRPRRSWRLNNDDIRERSLVFWTLYIFDAQLSFRQGRPVLLRDDEISVSIPSHLRDCMLLSDSAHIFAADVELEKSLRNLFIYNIELSRMLQALSRLMHTTSDYTSLEKSGLEWEENIEEFCVRLGPDWRIEWNCETQQLAKLPEKISLSVVVLNCFICLGRYVFRGWLLSHRLIFDNGGAVSKPHLSIAAIADHTSACENAASLVRLVSSLRKDRINLHWHLDGLPVSALHMLFFGIIVWPSCTRADTYMELLSIVVESSVYGIDRPNPLIVDPHLTHYLTFFTRCARSALLRAKAADKE